MEIWDWTAKDLAGARGDRRHFTSMTGYVEGDLIDPEGADDPAPDGPSVSVDGVAGPGHRRT